MPKFTVSGYAMIPVLVEMCVEASTPSAALKAAHNLWNSGESRTRFIVPGSEDTTAVHSWEPTAKKI